MSVEVLQSWVLQTGLMVSLLLVVILLIRRPFARVFGPNAAYALWSLPLIRLCFPVVSIPEKWIPEGLRPETFAPLDKTPAVATPHFNPNEILPEGLSTSGSAVSSGQSLMIIALMAWAGIGLMWLCFQLFQQRQFKARLLTESETVPPRIAAEARKVAQQMSLKKTPQIRVSKTGIGPLITGVFTPLVILPKTFESDFNAEQRRFVLTHEFAHLKRKDLWVALTALAFRAVNWPNPLVHCAAHRLRADQEAACDAYVIRITGGEAVHSYAETLVKAAKQATGTKPQVGQLALSLVETDQQNNEISKGD